MEESAKSLNGYSCLNQVFFLEPQGVPHFQNKEYKAGLNINVEVSPTSKATVLQMDARPEGSTRDARAWDCRV